METSGEKACVSVGEIRGIFPGSRCMDETQPDSDALLGIDKGRAIRIQSSNIKPAAQAQASNWTYAQRIRSLFGLCVGKGRKKSARIMKAMVV